MSSDHGGARTHPHNGSWKFLGLRCWRAPTICLHLIVSVFETTHGTPRPAIRRRQAIPNFPQVRSMVQRLNRSYLFGVGHHPSTCITASSSHKMAGHLGHPNCRLAQIYTRLVARFANAQAEAWMFHRTARAGSFWLCPYYPVDLRTISKHFVDRSTSNKHYALCRDSHRYPGWTGSQRGAKNCENRLKTPT